LEKEVRESEEYGEKGIERLKVRIVKERERERERERESQSFGESKIGKKERV
jgi:hypothetical protein